MKLLRFKWWQYGLIFLVSLPVSGFLLRQNNLRMLELRDAVVEIDQNTGDINQIEPSLIELRNYVFTHMNASLPAPLELPGSFNVSVEKARKKAEASGSANGEVYKKAQTECERIEIPLSVRAECIQNYVVTNAKPGTDPEQLDLPPKEQFVYSFVSPTWSFDLAGITTAITSILLILTLVRFTLDFIIPKLTDYIVEQPLE